MKKGYGKSSIHHWIFVATFCLTASAGAAVIYADGFDGTAIDAAKWEVTQLDGASVSQNDAIDLSIPIGGYADVTSRQVMVGVGASAKVQVILHAPPAGQSFGSAFLLLSSNSAGPGMPDSYDSYETGVELGFEPNSLDIASGVWWYPPMTDGQVGYGQAFFSSPASALGKRITVQVERTSLTTARFSFLSTVTGEIVRSYDSGITVPDGRPIPNELFVTLTGYGSVSFDNLVIVNPTFVPEPLGILLEGMICLLGCARRRH